MNNLLLLLVLTILQHKSNIYLLPSMHLIKLDYYNNPYTGPLLVFLLSLDQKHQRLWLWSPLLQMLDKTYIFMSILKRCFCQWQCRDTEMPICRDSSGVAKHWGLVVKSVTGLLLPYGSALGTSARVNFLFWIYKSK